MSDTRIRESQLLSENELVLLYKKVKWDTLFDKDLRPGTTFQDYYRKLRTIALFKVLALPFLLPIPTERSLAREINERELLQQLCGPFGNSKASHSSVPTRPNLWHFRRKYTPSGEYGNAMIKILVALTIVGVQNDIPLPFVEILNHLPTSFNKSVEMFRLSLFGAKIELLRNMAPAGDTNSKTIESAQNNVSEDSTRIYEQLSLFETKTSSQNRNLSSDGNKVPRSRWFTVDIGLPIEASIVDDVSSTCVTINNPGWLYRDIRLMDPLTSIGPTYRTRAYTACNVLVIREVSERKQVLLGKRLVGFGKGTYSLPGGKKQPDETVKDGAARELKEETSLELLKSRPISLHTTELPNKPLVKSVGILAESYKGSPKLLESIQNEAWDWYYLDQLPFPLFEPTRLVINDYMKDTFPNLKWEDVEEIPSQLSLPLSDE